MSDGLIIWPDIVMLLFVVTHKVCDGLIVCDGIVF